MTMYVCMYVCMYVYCTCYAPICHANGVEKASFAWIVGACYNNECTVSEFSNAAAIKLHEKRLCNTSTWWSKKKNPLAKSS